MEKVSLFWEQVMEFRLGSHSENVWMTFFSIREKVLWTRCVWARNGSHVIKESLCVSETVEGVEKGGHYVVLVEIEGIGRKEKRHKWKISFSTGWFLVRYSNFAVNAPLGSPLNNNTQAVKCTHTFRDTLEVHSDPVFVCEMICSLYCIFTMNGLW